jgi:hypothetical protein
MLTGDVEQVVVDRYNAQTSVISAAKGVPSTAKGPHVDCRPCFQGIVCPVFNCNPSLHQDRRASEPHRPASASSAAAGPIPMPKLAPPWIAKGLQLANGSQHHRVRPFAGHHQACRSCRRSPKPFRSQPRPTPLHQLISVSKTAAAMQSHCPQFCTPSSDATAVPPPPPPPPPGLRLLGFGA